MAPIAEISRADPEAMRDQARQWAQIVKVQAQPKMTSSILQLLTTVLPLVGLWVAMMFTVADAYWATLLMSVLAAGFTVRLFIIQHDCAHRSFFRSGRLNDLVGTLIGIVTLTPHAYWRRTHNAHHATCGNLAKRGVGDIDLLTVAEYTALSGWKRLAYRLYRNPATVLGIGPIYLFVIKHRLPLDLIRRHPLLLISVMITNLGIAGILIGLGFSFGFIDVLMVQLPIVVLSSAAGVWLFYIQHQFEDTHWRKDDSWDFHEASVMSSSYYDLPQPLRWFSGNIGIHHIHHLSCRIPNYRLKECLASIPAFETLNRIGLRESFSCLRLALWDENSQRLISFKNLRQLRSSSVLADGKRVLS